MTTALPPENGSTPSGRATALIRRFLPPDAFGTCRSCAAADVPEPFRQLLDHQSHMTVAMETLHGQAVSLEVLAVAERPATDADPFGYAREIVLRCARVNPELFPEASCRTPPEAGWVVQYGIVGIALERLPNPIAEAIRRQVTPLGRILIEAGLHRQVRDVALIEVVAGQRLSKLFGGAGAAPGPRTYGRVATIDIERQPVISLLEVAAVPALS